MTKCHEIPLIQLCISTVSFAKHMMAISMIKYISIKFFEAEIKHERVSKILIYFPWGNLTYGRNRDLFKAVRSYMKIMRNKFLADFVLEIDMGHCFIIQGKFKMLSNPFNILTFIFIWYNVSDKILEEC